MSLLLTRDQVKAILGLGPDPGTDDDSYDVIIDTYLPVVTTWFENYCDRGLAARDYVEQIHDSRTRRIYLYGFPINDLTSVVREDDLTTSINYRFNSQGGYIYPDFVGQSSLYNFSQLLTVTYNGGYAQGSVPADLALAFAVCVGTQGSVSSSVITAASSSGGSAIKAIGLGGGALSVQFDSGKAAGGISGTFDISNVPTEVQAYASVLNRYVRQRA